MAYNFPLVLIKGAGDLATGIALRLHHSGFPVVMTETEHPLAVRRRVAFAQAVFAGSCEVEGMQGKRCTLADVSAVLAEGAIPVLVDPQTHSLVQLRPPVVVDAIMAKRNTGTLLTAAPLVIALGPGFTVGIDCHAIVETNRGHNLGRVLRQGSAEPDTGAPGELPGAGAPKPSRVLRAPQEGYVESLVQIGDRVVEGQTIAVMRSPEISPESDLGQDPKKRPRDSGSPWDGGESDPISLAATALGQLSSTPSASSLARPLGAAQGGIAAPFDGVLRGIIHPSVLVAAGVKIGDVDPRAERSHCFTVSDKALAIAGGVLEAILAASHSSQKNGA
jgi:xanthine dehydrogenase accessory factor